jgi:hypothetical protein
MQSSHTLDQLDIAFDDTTTPSLDQITPLPVPWSCAMVTTDGSTLRTTSGMPPVAACALGGDHRGGGRAGLRPPAERAAGQGRGEQGGHRQRQERQLSPPRTSDVTVVVPCGGHRPPPL